MTNHQQREGRKPTFNEITRNPELQRPMLEQAMREATEQQRAILEKAKKMTADEKIKEVMECVNLLTTATHQASMCGAIEGDGESFQHLVTLKIKARLKLEDKLRELIKDEV